METNLVNEDLNEVLKEALKQWGMSQATYRLVAERENKIFQISHANQHYALRIRRPGLRSPIELQSELVWLNALGTKGLDVPKPMPSLSGNWLEQINGYWVDVISWLNGQPLGESRQPLTLPQPEKVFFALGIELACLHDLSDRLSLPQSFERPHWDIDGLIGETPHWGRFWDNPTLDEKTKSLLIDFRHQAHLQLTERQSSLDFGLIHADPVRENILIDNNVDEVKLIDFDDSGYGYRIFDIATALIKNRHEPHYADLEQALIEGYQSRRQLDVSSLKLFLAIRASSYVGWIISRLHEPETITRNQNLIEDARQMCADYLRY